MDGERKRGWGGRRRRSGEWEKVEGMGQVKREREKERERERENEVTHAYTGRWQVWQVFECLVALVRASYI